MIAGMRCVKNTQIKSAVEAIENRNVMNEKKNTMP